LLPLLGALLTPGPLLLCCFVNLLLLQVQLLLLLVSCWCAGTAGMIQLQLARSCMGRQSNRFDVQLPGSVV
jgi:hypothetical protein